MVKLRSFVYSYFEKGCRKKCTLFPTFLEIAVNEFSRQQSWKEYPRTKSANAKNFAYKRGLIGGEICSSNVSWLKTIWTALLKIFIYSFPNLNSWNSLRYRVYLKGLCMPNSTLTDITLVIPKQPSFGITQPAYVVWLSIKRKAQKNQVLPDIICILSEHL